MVIINTRLKPDLFKVEDVRVEGGRVLLTSTEVQHDVVLDGEGGQAGAGHDGEETGLDCRALCCSQLSSPLVCRESITPADITEQTNTDQISTNQSVSQANKYNFSFGGFSL